LEKGAVNRIEPRSQNHHQLTMWRLGAAPKLREQVHEFRSLYRRRIDGATVRDDSATGMLMDLRDVSRSQMSTPCRSHLSSASGR